MPWLMFTDQTAKAKRQLDQTELSKQVHALPTDPEGLVHLGDDGVVRSWAANHTVLGYLALSPSEIAVWISNPRYTQEKKDHFKQLFDGIDGRTVPQEEIFSPREEIWPHAFSNLEKRAGCVGQDKRSIPEPVSINEADRAKFRLKRAANECFGWCRTGSDCVAGCLCQTTDCEMLGDCA